MKAMIPVSVLNCQGERGRTLSPSKEDCEASGGKWIEVDPNTQPLSGQRTDNKPMTEGIIIRPLNCNVQGVLSHAQSKEDCEKQKGQFFEHIDRSK